MANEITSANAVQAIVKLVAGKALPALGPNFVMAAFVNRNYDAVLAQAGDAINIPIAPNLSANNIAEGGTVTNQNPSLGNAQITLNSHFESTFTIPNVPQALASPSLIDTYMQPAVLAIAEKIEGDLLNLYGLFTANTSVGTASSPLTESTIDSGETALFNARMADSIQKYLVVSGTAYSQLRQISRFTESRMTGDNSGDAIYRGTILQAKNCMVVRSQKVISSGGTTNNLMFGSDAICLVTRALPQVISGTGAVSQNINSNGFGMRVVMSYNPQTLSQQFTVDCLYGIGILRNQFAVPVLS